MKDTADTGTEGKRKRLRGVQETADTEIEGKIQRIQIKRKRERDR